MVCVTATARVSFPVLLLTALTRRATPHARRLGRCLDRLCRDARGDGGGASLAAARWPGIRRAHRLVRGLCRVRGWFKPLQIKSVTFANGSTANKWAVVSDTGGKAEVLGDSFRRSDRLLQLRRAVLHLPLVRVQRHQLGVHLRRRLPGHQVRLRAGRPVRHHHAVRRPVRPRLHLLRHRDKPGSIAARRPPRAGRVVKLAVINGRAVPGGAPGRRAAGARR